MININQTKLLLKELYKYMCEKLNFNPNIKVFLKNDTKNSENILGKTAYFEPKNNSITIFITNRHPKDCARSFAHEMYHAYQYSNGKIDDNLSTEEGYAQKDKNLRELEKEAYLNGNILFRDFEDMKKKEKGECLMENKTKIKIETEKDIKKIYTDFQEEKFNETLRKFGIKPIEENTKEEKENK